MVDLTKDSKLVAIDLINEANGTSFTDKTIALSGAVVNNFVLNGLNTEVVVSPNAGNNNDIPVTVHYSRLHLNHLLERPYAALENQNPSRLAGLLPSINAKYRLGLTAADIVDGPYRPDDVATGIKHVQITANAPSYAYIGKTDIYLGEASLVVDWFERPHYQFSRDFGSVTFMGNSYSFGETGTRFAGPSQAIVLNSRIKAVSIDTDRQYRAFESYPVNGILVAHFNNGAMKEIVGNRGETSYDENGVLLDIMPTLPSFMSNIHEDVRILKSYANGNITYSTDYDVSVRKAKSGLTYYVDNVAGNDLNDGQSEGKAFKSFNRALMAVPQARIIMVKGTDVRYDANNGWTSSVNNRSLDVIGYGTTKPVFSATVNDLTWTQQSESMWFTDRIRLAAFIDLANSTLAGGAVRMTAAKTLDDCRLNQSTYFIDTVSGRTYVHLFNDRKPDNQVLGIIASNSGRTENGSSVYIENLKFEYTYRGFHTEITQAKSVGYLYAKNCDFGWSWTDAGFNSWGTNVIVQGCTAQYCQRGGFRYNSDRVTPTMGIKPWVVEINAVVKQCGFDGTGNGIGSSISGNVTIMRIGGNYSECEGNFVQDTGDNTNSLNLSLTAFKSKWNNPDAAGYTNGMNSVRSALAHYWSCSMDSSALSIYPKGKGEAYLHNTSVGARPCYQRETPYRFIYTKKG
ncbi:pectin lyase [Serratia phage vB_SmaS-Totoro]|nr:pectin lyase [Serratia phage vB_SmaS-Totoro]